MTVVVAGREIEGVLACPPISTQRRSGRWFVLELYALADGGWLVHRTGMSVIYHRSDTLCQTRTGAQSGDPASVDDLPDDADPCTMCEPEYPEDLPDGKGVIRYEFPRHSWDECESPAVVKIRLTTVRSRDGSVSEFTSKPVDRLLRSAALAYPEFAPLLAA